MRMLPLAIWILSVACLCRGYEYEDYYAAKDESEATAAEDETLAVSNLDELLELLYPKYSVVQRCLQKREQSKSVSAHNKNDLWQTTRQLALFKMDGTFEVIMEEMQRTACRPREVCLEVSKEFPESANHIYLPRCVSVHRCGGCCPNEALQCTNTSYAIINKTLVELSPPRMENSVVMVAVVNHTSCECQSKRPRHTIIRRAAAEYPTLCSIPEESCSPGLVWDPSSCSCSPDDMLSLVEQELDPMDSALLAICGPNKLLDEESCGCVCRNGLTEASCAPGWRLDEMSCKCVCEGLAAGQTCPPNQHWDQDLCGCVCQIQCPPSHPLHPETCTCQCRENEHTCLQQGKKFRSENCSCYRLPCKDPHKKCQNGHFYSPLVCSCIPNYLRSWS